MKQRKTNPEEQVGSQSIAGNSLSPAETVLLVALWATPPVDDQADDLDATPLPKSQVAVPSSVVAMVRDLLTADGGNLRESVQDSLSASFRETVYAVNAARHVQRQVREFSRTSTTTGPLYASYTLMAASEPDANRFTADHTHSGQILCSGSLCETIRTVPGLQFTSLPADPSGGPASHGTILQLLPPVPMEGYVHEALEPRIPVSSKPSPALPMHGTAQSGSVLLSGAISPVPAETISIKTVNPRLVIGGVAGVAVLGTILIFSPLRWNSLHPASQPKQAAPAASDKPVVAEPTPSSPTTQPSLDEASEAALQKQRDQERSRSVPAPPSASAQADADTPRPGRSGVNFSSAEIEDLILRADKDSDNGAYDHAILEYRMVLNNDPSNALAKKGLSKALYNKSHQ